MATYEDIPRVAMQLSRDVLVASIQVDLDDRVLARFRDDLLDRVHARSPRAVILDVSGVDTLDSEEFASLRGIVATVNIMGTQSVLVGMPAKLPKRTGRKFNMTSKAPPCTQSLTP